MLAWCDRCQEQVQAAGSQVPQDSLEMELEAMMSNMEPTAEAPPEGRSRVNAQSRWQWKVFPRGPREVLVGFQSWAQRPQKIQSHPNQRLQLPSLLDVKALLGRRNVTGLSIWTFGSNLLVLEFLSFYRQAKILIRMPKRSPKKKVRWHFWLLKGTVK